MLAASSPDRIQIAFDDDRLVDHAGLLLPATLAESPGLSELMDAHLNLGDAPDRANAGDYLLTLVAWAAGAGPGEKPLTIDIAPTLCETYGLVKEGARQAGYHPMLGGGRFKRDVDGAAAQGPRPQRPRRRPLPAQDCDAGPQPEPRDSSRCAPTAASTAKRSSTPAGPWMCASR